MELLLLQAARFGFLGAAWSTPGQRGRSRSHGGFLHLVVRRSDVAKAVSAHSPKFRGL